MISLQLQQEYLEKITSDPANKSCFECGTNSNAWASVNNGIFLCLNCAGIHRGFGVNVSFMRSVDMDSWTQKQINLMLQGGNAKLKKYFEKYNIPTDAPMDYKFKTKAGIYYRERLRCIAEGEAVPEAPTQEEALELISFQNPNFINDMSRNDRGNQQEKKDDLDLVVDQMKSLWSVAYKKTAEASKVAGEYAKEAYKKADEKYHDPQFQQSLQSAKESAATNAKKGYESVKSGVFGVFNMIKTKIDQQQNK